MKGGVSFEHLSRLFDRLPQDFNLGVGSNYEYTYTHLDGASPWASQLSRRGRCVLSSDSFFSFA